MKARENNNKIGVCLFGIVISILIGFIALLIDNNYSDYLFILAFIILSGIVFYLIGLAKVEIEPDTCENEQELD